MNDDDEFDEGSQVVIGRTHFFTGDRRTYQGMPVSSVVDAKDRSMGDQGSVSGLARRKGASAWTWDDGEYGRKESDYLPWSKRERAKKMKTYDRLFDE